MTRAFSLLAIKSVDADERIFRGVASTPEPDRVDDIVEPLGLRFKNPLPLLWAHKHDRPVGLVRFDRPTKAGITFEAKIPHVEEAGVLKDQVDHAWHAVKHGVVRAVSIGFRPIETEPIAGGGVRFKRSELLELSLVAVPANAGATITEIRSIDAAIREGSGLDQRGPCHAAANQGYDDWAQGEGAIKKARRTLEELFGEKLKSRGFLTAMDPMHFAIGKASMAALKAGMVQADQMFAEMDRRMTAIEQRAKSFESMTYQGVWRAGKYDRGAVVTFNGSMWHANRTTVSTPGKTADWTLCVRAGRKGRDARP